MGLVPVAPIQGCFGFDGAVVPHGVGADLSLAVYLHGERVARIERAAFAVPVLADARRRCAPGLRLAALHSEGDAGYLQRVLSFGQTVAVRQFVLRAPSASSSFVQAAVARSSAAAARSIRMECLFFIS